LIQLKLKFGYLNDGEKVVERRRLSQKVSHTSQTGIERGPYLTDCRWIEVRTSKLEVTCNSSGIWLFKTWTCTRRPQWVYALKSFRGPPANFERPRREL